MSILYGYPQILSWGWESPYRAMTSRGDIWDPFRATKGWWQEPFITTSPRYLRSFDGCLDMAHGTCLMPPSQDASDSHRSSWSLVELLKRSMWSSLMLICVPFLELVWFRVDKVLLILSSLEVVACDDYVGIVRLVFMCLLQVFKIQSKYGT